MLRNPRLYSSCSSGPRIVGRISSGITRGSTGRKTAALNHGRSTRPSSWFSCCWAMTCNKKKYISLIWFSATQSTAPSDIANLYQMEIIQYVNNGVQMPLNTCHMISHCSNVIQVIVRKDGYECGQFKRCYFENDSVRCTDYTAHFAWSITLCISFIIML